MVMDAPPSPHSVGREFVRQYYTLLNKAPTHLHRFYNNQSSFVHGGLDPPYRETMPMIGQKQIHQKIQQLNFQDCHAKITQVDAQATLGNGVVVQVTGELSNAGQPMRRFTQTFVLAAQSPKKYYVHNDIFRYQDEIISDEECENDQRSGDEMDEINNQEQQRHELPPPQINNPQPIPYYNPAANAAATMATVHHVMQQQQPPQQQMPTVNGTVHQDELIAGGGNIPQHISNPIIPQTQQQQQPLNQTQQVVVPQIVPSSPPAPEEAQQQQQVSSINEANDDVDANDSGEYVVESQAEQVDQLQDDMSNSEHASNEPKTYATLLKSGGGAYSYVALAAVPPQPSKSISPPPPVKLDNRETQGGGFQVGQVRNNRGGDSNRGTRLPPRPRQDYKSVQPRNSEDGSFFEERRRSQGNFSDSNQLFLGNLPLTATEDDLRQIFEKFGTIVDLRIHSKPNNNSNNKSGPPLSRAPPNYGFITYETQDGVNNCLTAKPIFLQSSDKSIPPTILNVEEKKTKAPYGGGGMRVGGGAMDNNMGRGPPRDNNGPRRGPMAGGGGQGRGGGGGPMGGPGGGRPNSFRGGPPNRGPTTYNSRR